jgi:hypothetical protein
MTMLALTAPSIKLFLPFCFIIEAMQLCIATVIHPAMFPGQSRCLQTTSLAKAYFAPSMELSANPAFTPPTLMEASSFFPLDERGTRDNSQEGRLLFE